MLRRGRVVLLICCFGMVLIAGAWVSAMSVASPTWTPFPSDTPFNINGTATVLQATIDTYATANSPILPFPTQDFVVLTDNANADNDLIDPIYVTATYIVDRATQTEAYYKTATANPIDPVYITASAVVAQATQLEAAYMTVTAGGTFTLPTTFPTALPTLSDEESAALLNRWATALEQATGFSHPLLDVIAYEYLREIQNYQQTRQSFDKFEPDLEIKPIVTRIKFGGDEYIALVIRQPITWFATLWIFRVKDNKPILLGDATFSLGGLYGDFDSSEFEFGDFNRNGLPDLVVDFNSGGSCPSTWVGLLEIQPDGTVVDVAKTIPGNEPDSPRVATSLYTSIIRYEMVDINQDGISELKVVGRYFDFPKDPNLGGSCYFLPVSQYYAWGEKGYHDITPTLDESYYPEIDAYFKNVEEAGCSLPSEQVIVDYFVLGRLEEGWRKIASQIHLEMCSVEMLAEQGEAIGRHLAWVGTLLELEKQAQSVKR